jgi:hypothetical protein
LSTGVEAVRARYRPERIMTLFVGESAPASGKFFYFGDTAMTRNMERALTAAGLTGSGDFLQNFKALGWYLDDLVLIPVNQLDGSQRKAMCLAAEKSLADRIAEYRPLAIVSLMFGIRDIVESAATMAGSKADRYAVPFPGMGQQVRFQRAMENILPKLPRELA